MKLVLYKYLPEDGLRSMLYVKRVTDGKPVFTQYAGDANSYYWLHAMFLSLWLSVSWVNVKYVKK